MTRQEYKNYYCTVCCKKCENIKFNQEHCLEQDIIDGTWEQAEIHLIDKASNWFADYLSNIDGELCSNLYDWWKRDSKVLIGDEVKFRQAMEEK